MIKSAIALLMALSSFAAIADTSAALEFSLKQIIQPSFADFYTQAQNFSNATAAFAQHTDSTHFEQARSAWKTLSTSWNRVRIFRFGPLVGKGLTPYAYYFDSRLLKGKDFSKAIQQDIRVSSKHSTTTAHLAQTLADKNFKYQGLPATEILLFGAAYPLSAYQKNKTLAGYLHAHALVLKQRAQFIHESWQDDVYVNKLLTETDNTQGKLFNALWDSMGFAHKERLSALYAQEQVFPHRAEAWRSEHSKQNLLAWAQALHAVFSAEQGFYALLKASGYKTGDVFLQQLGVMQTALHELPGSLSASLKHDWRSVDKIATALNLVMGTFERDVVNTLGVNLGFNFNDGD